MERTYSKLDKVTLGASRAVLIVLPMTKRCLPMSQVNSEPEKNTNPQETHSRKSTFHAWKEKEGSYFCYKEEGSTLNFAWGAFFLVNSPINGPGIHEVVSGHALNCLAKWVSEDLWKSVLPHLDGVIVPLHFQTGNAPLTGSMKLG